MKRYLLNLLLILGLGLGLAYAQNATKGVAVSQDPTGTIGFDSVQGGVYLPGHLLSINRLATPPVLSSCVAGTGGSFAGTDFVGAFTQGNTAATTCTVTFGTPFQVAPACMVTWNTGPLAAMSWTTSTTALTITQTSATTSKISYICSSSG